MIALFDSGSSYLHFGWYDHGEVIETASIPYPDSSVILADSISGLFGKRKPVLAAACSVHSQWREQLFSILEHLVPGKLHIAREASDVNLTVRYDNPSQYGIDRALAVHAAYNLYRDSCVVIDAGTAVTIDAVAHDGSVVGGYIFPGGQTLLHGLTDKTALPPVTIEYDNPGIGTSTERSISFGLSIGLSGALTNLIEHAAGYVSCGDRLIITGGDAESVMTALTLKVGYKPHLVLEGLGLTADKLPKYA